MQSPQTNPPRGAPRGPKGRKRAHNDRRPTGAPSIFEEADDGTGKKGLCQPGDHRHDGDESDAKRRLLKVAPKGNSVAETGAREPRNETDDQLPSATNTRLDGGTERSEEDRRARSDGARDHEADSGANRGDVSEGGAEFIVRLPGSATPPEDAAVLDAAGVPD